MAGFNVYSFVSTQADGLFNAALEYGDKQITPTPGPATVQISSHGGASVYSIAIQGSIDGVIFENIQGYGAVTADGCYPLRMPLNCIRIYVTAIDAGDILAKITWVYD